jgi:hypothetical protein
VRTNLNAFRKKLNRKEALMPKRGARLARDARHDHSDEIRQLKNLRDDLLLRPSDFRDVDDVPQLFSGEISGPSDVLHLMHPPDLTDKLDGQFGSQGV